VSGKHVNGEQVKLYKEKRSNGKTQRTAAAIAGISERTGRRIEKGTFRLSTEKKRHWRTHPDDFQEVWTHEIVPRLRENPYQSATKLFRYLQEKYPRKYSSSKLRTFQRRVHAWKQKNNSTLSAKGTTIF
jgi:DNA-binding XRE family transcriptional regulator